MTATRTSTLDAPASRGALLTALLWLCQILLALAFLAHGILFLAPPPDIAAQMNANLPRWFSLFLGVAEVLAAIGLTIPAVVRRHQWLMAWAAAGIMIVTASATVYHLSRGENSSAFITFILLAMAAVVFITRRRDYPRF